MRAGPVLGKVVVATTGHALRIVLVDDEPGVRLLARLALEDDDGLNAVIVGEAGDGQAGIELVARLRPDVVCLDVEMPLLGGLAALPEILRVSPESRVCVVSGADADTTAGAALAAGALAYLEKSQVASSLAATVRGLVGR